MTDMNLGTFAFITGIASLLGLVLQLKDVFPKHREARKTVFLIVLGVFIGTILSAFQHVSIKLDFPLTGFSILVGSAITVISTLAVIGALTKDSVKRNKIFEASGLGVVALLVLLFGYAAFSHAPAVRDITDDELLLLADKNIEKGNIERAIKLLEMVKQRFESDDPRVSIINNKIENLKRKQFQGLQLYRIPILS